MQGGWNYFTTRFQYTQLLTRKPRDDILIKKKRKEMTVMNKIAFCANPDTNYVYHMLSVSRCGYDNAYGEEYRSRYPAEDLQTIKQYEKELTVSGGEHCGSWYHLMVIIPARGEQKADEFYGYLLECIRTGDVPEEWVPHAEGIAAVARVMVKYYADYVQNIWPIEKEKIVAHYPAVQQLFEESHFTEKAEAAVGCTLPAESFRCMLVTSIAKGPEAIDISPGQDVFGIERTAEDAFYFIGHEFIIYLLKEALKEEDAFMRLETWMVTESLAEYYLKKVLGNTRLFKAQQQYVDFWESLPGHEEMTAVQLYRLGWEKRSFG